MPFSVAELARLTGLAADGDAAIVIDRPAEPASAGPRDLALAMSERYADAVAASLARVAVLWDGADWRALGLEAALFAPRARVALAAVTEVWAEPHAIAPGIAASAEVHADAVIGEGVAIGPFVVIGPGARIGAGTVILSHASVGAGSEIGPGSLLHPGVHIGPRVRTGARFVAQAGAVVGADGFSWVTPEPGAVESAKREGTVGDGTRDAAFRRIHSLGGVDIGDDVDVGANAAIDAGTIAPTRIGAGTKIDNLVQIGHNCRIGSLCLICGHVGLAGSVTVGDRVVLGGKVGVGDNLDIGDDTVIAGGSLIGNSIPARSVIMGAPGIPRDEWYRQMLALRRLPRLQNQLRELRAKLGL